MRFQTLEDLKRISELLTQADFERADCRWEASGAFFSAEISRPLSERLKAGGLAVGLIRKPQSEWAKSRLTIRRVKQISLWEEYGALPAGEGLLMVESQASALAWKLTLASAHGLRVTLLVDQLEGELEDLP